MSNLPAPFKYQEYIEHKIMARLRTAVIARAGAGKTRPIVTALDKLGCYMQGPVLIVCSGPAIATWTRQIPLWTENRVDSGRIFVVSGKPRPDRVALWTQANDTHHHRHSGVYIVNSNTFYRDREMVQDIKWTAIVCDEYHRFMRRRKSNTFKWFMSAQGFRKTPIVIWATASFLNKDASSAFTSFQMCDPGLFRSYWKFANTYCLVDDGHFGKQVHGVRNAAAFHKIRDRYLAYVPDTVVAEQLPDGRREAIDVQPTNETMALYDQIRKELLVLIEYDIDEDPTFDVLAMPNSMAAFIKLRQLLVCPRILHPTLGMGAGYEMVLDSLQEEPHVVIFVPFRDACVLIADALRDEGYDAYILRGGTPHDVQQQIIADFEKTRGILVCTIQYAESFDLLSCHTSWFLGQSYVLDENRQAEGRTQRAISEHDTVFWKYVRNLDTIEEEIIDGLSGDMRNVNRLMASPEEFIRMLSG